MGWFLVASVRGNPKRAAGAGLHPPFVVVLAWVSHSCSEQGTLGPSALPPSAAPLLVPTSEELCAKTIGLQRLFWSAVFFIYSQMKNEVQFVILA